MLKYLHFYLSFLSFCVPVCWAASSDVSPINVKSPTPLEKTALAVDFDAVEKLLKKGIDPCGKTNFEEVKGGETIPTILKRLIVHAQNEKKDRYALMLKLLESQKCGQPFDEKTFDNMRKSGEHQIEASVDQRKRPNEYTLFRRAIRSGKIDDVKRYLDQGFYPDAPTPDEIMDSGLHFAVQTGQPEILKELIRHVPGVDVENKNGWTPLWVAVAVYPVKPENLKVTEILLNEGADVNHRINGGAVPIMSAFAGQNIDMLKLVFSHRPLLNITDGRGIAPIAWHVSHWNNIEAVRLYLQAGADPNLKAPPISKSAIDVAREKNDMELLRVLQGKSN